MKKFFICIFLALIAIEVYSQSSDVITDILDSKEVTMGQVCYLSAVQQGLINENASYTDAVNALYKEGQIPVAIYEAALVPLVNIAYIYAQAWNIKGGLFYRMFHGAPRYAYKQMKADGILPEGADPAMILSGQEALNLYTSCLIQYGHMELSVD